MAGVERSRRTETSTLSQDQLSIQDGATAQMTAEVIK